MSLNLKFLKSFWGRAIWLLHLIVLKFSKRIFYRFKKVEIIFDIQKFIDSIDLAETRKNLFAIISAAFVGYKKRWEL